MPQYFNCHTSFPTSFATELHEEAYWKQLLALFFILSRHFEVISQNIANTRESKIEQGISTGEMLRACVENQHVRLSANQRNRTLWEDNIRFRSHISIKHAALPNDWRRYYGNKLAEWKKIHGIRAILR